MTAYAGAGTLTGALPPSDADAPAPIPTPDLSRARRAPSHALSLGQGQSVIVVARWVLVLAGLLLAVWNPAEIGELRVQIVVLLGLAVANFYLHAQMLTRRPVRDAVMYAASAADVVVITALVLAQGGFGSDLYIFYYIAALAWSVAFPTRETALFTAVTGGLYAMIALGSLNPSDAFHQPQWDDNLVILGARLVVLAGIAFCGNLYWRMERTRRLSAAVEDAEDLFFGQAVIVWGRWFAILAAALVALWSASTPGELSARMLLVVAMMAMNFFLHGRQLLDKPANRGVVLAAGALDLALVTAMLCGWQGGAGGLRSDLFVLYYPALVGMAFVFRPRLAAIYTAAAIVLYSVTCLVLDTAFVVDGHNLKVFVARLVTLAAVGGLGAFYWRVARARRRTAASARASLQALSAA